VLPNAGGSISSGSGTAAACLARSMPKPTRPPTRSLKNLPEQVALVQHQHPQARVELWTMDEHRIGLKPILRRVWAPKGATVKAPVAHRYEGMDVFACVHPQSGQTSWLLLPTVSVAVFSLALAAFAEEVGAGPDKPIVLVLDRAGWHSRARLQLPEGIHLVFLPSYSPEVQPAERLWPLSNEPLANRVFTALNELEEVQAERCRWLQAHPEIVQAHTCFHWWPFLVDST